MDTPTGAVVDLPTRGRVRGRGVVDRITVLPRDRQPRFSAVVSATLDAEKLTDRTPDCQRQPAVRLELIWLGQRTVPGVDAGTELVFEGMVSPVGGRPTIFNPRYQLVGRPEVR